MTRTIVACLVVALVAGGCAAHWPEEDRTLQGAQAPFNVPPKQMLATIKQIVNDPPLSLGVKEENKGSILTGYQSFPGDWHVARRWQEQTQYRIEVIPDFDEPTARCMVQVRERTEQRAADGMKWDTTPTIARPQRARDMLKQIEQKAGGAKP